MVCIATPSLASRELQSSTCMLVHAEFGGPHRTCKTPCSIRVQRTQHAIQQGITGTTVEGSFGDFSNTKKLCQKIIHRDTL